MNVSGVRPPIVVMHCFARSGGTVLNQCLGALPEIVILSEVNPVAGSSDHGMPYPLQSVRDQARNWYGIELQSDGYATAVRELAGRCSEQGKQLVVRDWTFVNFFPFAPNGMLPADRFLTLEALVGAGELRPFAFVRDPIDIWVSMRLKIRVDSATFFRHYRRHVEALLASGMPVFKYEEFCERPEAVLREICAATGLSYSEAWRNYATYTKVKGDVQFDALSRGGKQGDIRPLLRRRQPREVIEEIETSADMIAANRLLGYPVDYAGRPLESRWRGWREQLQRLFWRVSKHF